MTVSTQRLKAHSLLVNVILAAVEKAARNLIRDFGEIEQLQASKKTFRDFVSRAEKRSEQILIQELTKARPQFSFLTEESGYIDGEDTSHRWIIDPLDGTTNFLHGIPHFAINVALQKDDEIIAAVTYDPIKDEAFWAEKGKGAFLNRKRIRVSGRQNSGEALVGIGVPFAHRGKSSQYEKRLNHIMPLSAAVRRMGAVALDLAYVACGRYDFYFEDPVNFWDIAAGILLVKEAGGIVSSMSGTQNIIEEKTIIASNVNYYQSFLDALNK